MVHKNKSKIVAVGSATAFSIILGLATIANAAVITKTLTVGSTGTQVTTLQTILINDGYLKAKATGYFGSLTKKAVVLLQKDNSLSPVGIVGPKTRLLINTTGSVANTSSDNTPSSNTPLQSSGTGGVTFANGWGSIIHTNGPAPLGSTTVVTTDSSGGGYTGTSYYSSSGSGGTSSGSTSSSSGSSTSGASSSSTSGSSSSSGGTTPSSSGSSSSSSSGSTSSGSTTAGSGSTSGSSSSSGSTSSGSTSSGSGATPPLPSSGSISGLTAYAGCALPNYTKAHHVYYIDPINGTSTGNGSQAHPWSSLQTVITSGKIASQTAIASTTAPIQPGDVIELMSGNYGNIRLQGDFSGADYTFKNPDFITIEAAPGQTPVLGQLLIFGGDKWVFHGLTIQNTQPNLVTVSLTQALVYIKGRHHDIIFDGNTLGSALPTGWSQADLLKNWTQADWLANAPGGIYEVAPTYNGGTCITITNNTFTDIGGPAAIGSQRSQYVLISGNKVNYFLHDGIDYGGNDTLISKNVVTNHLDGGDIDVLHPDCMQGQAYGWTATKNGDFISNVTIDSNTCIRQTDPNLPFMNLTKIFDNIQGIDSFDGSWTNLKVTNNVIVTATNQGISYYGAYNTLIANNTVLSDGLTTTMVPWIQITNPKAQYHLNPSDSVIIRNNIVSNITVTASTTNWTIDHNLIPQIPGVAHGTFFYPVAGGESYNGKVGTYLTSNVITPLYYKDIFVTYDSTSSAYDLHPKSGSAAVGTGSSDGTPTVDITGAARTTPHDLGAYNHF